MVKPSSVEAAREGRLSLLVDLHARGARRVAAAARDGQHAGEVSVPRHPSHAARALLALALLAGFYLVALAAAGALLAAPIARWRAGGTSAADVFLVALAGVVLRGTFLVRGPRFEAPGPEITAAEQPELFAVIRRVATTLGTRMPRHVYLVADVNAYVAEVGGVLGMGSRRVLAVGVGLLAVQTVSELEATLAHELGHHAGGDTRLGSLTYRARGAVARLLASLDGSWVSVPFRLYGTLFMRATQGISRAQELVADRCGAAVAGTASQIGALERTSRSGALFAIFLAEELEPLVELGRRPENLYDGFRAYEEELLAQGRIARLEAALAGRPTDAYDSHPSLPERVAALRRAVPVERPVDDRPARSLLVNPERIERDLTARLTAGAAPGADLEPVSWTDVAAHVFGPHVLEEARRYAERVSGRLGGAPTPDGALRALAVALARSEDEAAALVLEPDLASVPAGDRAGHVAQIVGRALGSLLAASLVERGGAWRSEVGRPLEIMNGATIVAPYEVAAEALADRASLVTVVTRPVDAA
jgi:heat shock protein HtpX